MPDYFSHSICAKIVLDNSAKSIKNAIADPALYMLGAQGGDVFFAYKFKMNKSNLGRKLHAISAEELFGILKDTNPSYAAGFATHYALDCTLHPAIYAFESGSKSPLAHMRFENDLGLFISRKFAIPRNILPRERILGATFALYDCIVKIEPEVTVTGIERCLKRYFSYTRALFKSKKQEYTFNYDFASLSGAVDDAVALAGDCVKAVLSGDVSSGLFSRSFLEK